MLGGGIFLHILLLANSMVRQVFEFEDNRFQQPSVAVQLRARLFGGFCHKLVTI